MFLPFRAKLIIFPPKVCVPPWRFRKIFEFLIYYRIMRKIEQNEKKWKKMKTNPVFFFVSTGGLGKRIFSRETLLLRGGRKGDPDTKSGLGKRCRMATPWKKLNVLAFWMFSKFQKDSVFCWHFLIFLDDFGSARSTILAQYDNLHSQTLSQPVVQRRR